ncbi:MAG: pyridoxal phosphate-dependent aminotransferase [Bacteroidota bacterium]|nr:pyridoxal phosphate-dependent aminotransferase [Bacteroidota bacterium]
MKPLADRTDSRRQSNIRAITLMLRDVDGINLGQGICDMPTPEPIKRGAHAAIDGDKSIYSYYGGIHRLREALLDKARTYNRIPAKGIDDIMVTVGSTGAFVATMFTLLDPGDEVIVFEPYYGYHCNLLTVMGASLKFVRTKAPEWEIDFEKVESLITDRTKAIIVTTPNNPTGKVWSRKELETMRDLLVKHDLYAITDEIYEYMLYDGHEHLSLASIEGAYDRTITLSGFSKTYNMTGWRLGYAVGPESIISKMGLLADLIYICAPTPLQYGVAEAFEMSDDYFQEMASAYDRKRTLMCTTLEEIGFNVPWPEGSYYVLADFSPLRERFDGFEDDIAASRTLVERAGIGTVAGRSFFADDADGDSCLRFCFAKEYDVLEEACRRLKAAFAPISSES